MSTPGPSVTVTIDTLPAELNRLTPPSGLMAFFSECEKLRADMRNRTQRSLPRYETEPKKTAFFSEGEKLRADMSNRTQIPAPLRNGAQKKPATGQRGQHSDVYPRLLNG